MSVTLTLPLAPPEPDYTPWPPELPWLPVAELAATWAAGDRRAVACDVSARLRRFAGRRATSVATMLALRQWRVDAFAQVIARIERKAELLDEVTA